MSIVITISIILIKQSENAKRKTKPVFKAFQKSPFLIMMFKFVFGLG